MIDYATFCQIKDYQRQGLNAEQIAQALGLHRHTVTKWLNRRDYQPAARTPRSSKLDPFKADIARWLDQHPYSAAQIFQRLREQGYDGGYTIVKAHVRRVRPRRAPAYLTLAFGPGECAQVFNTYPNGPSSAQKNCPLKCAAFEAERRAFLLEIHDLEWSHCQGGVASEASQAP